MSSRLIYICVVILLVGIQEIRAQQRDTIVIRDPYMWIKRSWSRCMRKRILWKTIPD